VAREIRALRLSQSVGPLKSIVEFPVHQATPDNWQLSGLTRFQTGSPPWAGANSIGNSAANVTAADTASVLLAVPSQIK
jgi:hypothetical protein